MPSFLITFYPGDMAQNGPGVAEARKQLSHWAKRVGAALADPGSPVRSVLTIGCDGNSDGWHEAPLLGWSVIEAADREEAARLARDHPLVGMGCVLRIHEPVLGRISL